MAAGKGVGVATTLQAAHEAIDQMLALDAHSPMQGEGKARVVIEGFLEGEEASFMVVARGLHAVPLATSQDHKRLGDGDTGPNTGGMGAYSPAPVVTPEIHARVMREVIQPALKGMQSEGMPYTGFLYAGLMIDGKGNIQVLEFNCRMGDPETEVVMPRLETDLVELILAMQKQELNLQPIQHKKEAACTVILVSRRIPVLLLQSLIQDSQLV